MAIVEAVFIGDPSRGDNLLLPRLSYLNCAQKPTEQGILNTVCVFRRPHLGLSFNKTDNDYCSIKDKSPTFSGRFCLVDINA